MTRLLGIDLGQRRIGLAVGDTETGVARGLATIARGDMERDTATLARLVREQRVEEFVLGLPLNADGSEGPQALVTRAWAADVLAGLRLSVTFRDEYLTSVAAEDRLGRMPRGRSGGPPSRAALERRRGAVDREAARLILQAELDVRRGVRS